MAKCSICSNPGLLRIVNGLLDDGMSNSGIAATFNGAGGKLDPDVVGRHKNGGHWAPKVEATGPQPTKRDLAILVRDKVYEAVEGKDPELLLLMGKEFAPMVGKGLLAQGQLDKRDAVKSKLSGAAEIVGMLATLLHAGRGAQVLLEDPNIIEGEVLHSSPVLHGESEE